MTRQEEIARIVIDTDKIIVRMENHGIDEAIDHFEAAKSIMVDEMIEIELSAIQPTEG